MHSAQRFSGSTSMKLLSLPSYISAATSLILLCHILGLSVDVHGAAARATGLAVCRVRSGSPGQGHPLKRPVVFGEVCSQQANPHWWV